MLQSQSPRHLPLFFIILTLLEDRDQKGGFLLSDLCIAHLGSLGGQVIFVPCWHFFDGLPSFLTSFHQFHCFMQWFGEKLLALLLYHPVDGAISYHGERTLIALLTKGRRKPRKVNHGSLPRSYCYCIRHHHDFLQIQRRVPLKETIKYVS